MGIFSDRNREEVERRGRDRRFNFSTKNKEGRENLALFTAMGVMIPKDRQPQEKRRSR